MKKVIITNSNDTIADAGNWAQLAPFGDFRGKALPLPGDSADATEPIDAIQRFDRAAAESLVNGFKSTWGRIKRFVKGCFLYHGHPDVAGFDNTDNEPKGMIADLEVRDDGLWCLPVFSDAGRALLEGPKLYLSGVWSSDFCGEENGVPVFRPDKLCSVGLTQHPNLPVKWINASDKANETNGTNERDASCEIISSAVNKALETGRITAAEVEAWRGRLKADFANESPKLEALAPKLKTESVTGDITARKSSFANSLMRFHELVQQRQAAGLTYREAFVAVQKEHPELLQPISLTTANQQLTTAN